MLRLTVLALMLAAPAAAQDAVTRSFPGSFDDATFAVENAIIDKGLVINTVAKIGDMLDRTGPAVGDTKQIYLHALSYEFCSATLSREVMEADPDNIGQCPYTIFVYETEQGVTIGHRVYPQGAMQKVQTFLDTILDDAIGG